jgi:NTE family protein
MSKKHHIGLALGGGGTRGAAHIGVLAELELAGIEVSHIAGTSAGSLVGALYAYGLSPEQILALALNTTWQDLIHLTIPRLGLANANRMEIILSDITNGANIEDLPIPFAAVACDLKTGDEVILNSGSVARAVRASCSIPGIFTPVEVDDALLVDGGIINGVPVNVARKMGARVVLAVKLHQGVEPAGQLDSVFAVLAQSLEIIQRSQQMEKPDILLTPDVSKQHIGDLGRMREAYLEGREVTKRALPLIRKAIEQAAQN